MNRPAEIDRPWGIANFTWSGDPNGNRFAKEECARAESERLYALSLEADNAGLRAALAERESGKKRCADSAHRWRPDPGEQWLTCVTCGATESAYIVRQEPAKPEPPPALSEAQREEVARIALRAVVNNAGLCTYDGKVFLEVSNSGEDYTHSSARGVGCSAIVAGALRGRP